MTVEQERKRTHLMPRERLTRTGLAAAAAFVSVNIWTGAPLLALWVGSRTALAFNVWFFLFAGSPI